MKPTEITDWLDEVKKDAGESYDRVSMRLRDIPDKPQDIGLVAFFPDGRICQLIMPVDNRAPLHGAEMDKAQ